MTQQELQIVARYFENEMISAALSTYNKLPNDITLQDILNHPEGIGYYSSVVFAFEGFFTEEYQPDETTGISLFEKYKLARNRIHFIDFMQLLTAVRGTKPKARAFSIYPLSRYRRVVAATKTGKLFYAAWLTAKGPSEWFSPLTIYYFVRAYFLYRFVFYPVIGDDKTDD